MLAYNYEFSKIIFQKQGKIKICYINKNKVNLLPSHLPLGNN